MKKSHHLYICAAMFPDGTYGPVKIGISRDAHKRRSQIQTGCPYEVALIHVLEMPSFECAKEVERNLHLDFVSRRTKGEWFQISPAQALKGCFYGTLGMARMVRKNRAGFVRALRSCRSRYSRERAVA